MSSSEAVELSLLEFFRHFARVRKTGRVAELDGISIASSGIAFHMFNAAFFSAPVTDSPEDLDRRIRSAAECLGGDGGGWAFWAGDGRLHGASEADASSAFRRAGLHAAFRHPGMACDALAAPRRPVAKVEFRRVENRSSRMEFVRLNSHAFRIPFEWCLELYDLDALWTPDFVGHIGYVDGNAVCGAATLVAAEAVGVYSVATLPGHERKGYGEAITRHAVACAQRESGLTRTVLQATKAGVPLYRRMGFELVTHFTVYT